MMKETVIFSLTSSVELTKEICDYLNLPVGKCAVRHFADGEILIEPEETVRGRSVFIIQSTCAPVSETLMEVLICLDACRRARAGEITVVTPYFGYARQDRKARARQPITAKLVANLWKVQEQTALLLLICMRHRFRDSSIFQLMCSLVIQIKLNFHIMNKKSLKLCDRATSRVRPLSMTRLNWR